jgi:hypothetical protein
MKNNHFIKYYIIISVFAVLITAKAFAADFIIQQSSTQNQTQPVSIPLTLNNSLSADIMSIELEIAYDSNVLTATGISLTGTVLDNHSYLFVFNTDIPGTIYAVFASSSEIYTGTGVLLYLDFTVLGTAGETSDITIVTSRFNNNLGISTDGIFTVAPNAAPAFANIFPQTGVEDTPHSFTISVSDIESNPCDLMLTFESSDDSIVSASSVSYTCMSGEYFISYTPSSNQAGNVSLTVTATDAGSLASSTTVDLTITSVNDAPEISSISGQTTDEEIPITVTFTATDIETTPCGFDITLTSSNQSLFIDSNLTYTCQANTYSIILAPEMNQLGLSTISILIVDSEGLTVSTAFDVTVTAVNDAPKIGTITDQTTLEDTAISGISLTATDHEDAPCSFDITATTTDLTLIPNENITYTCNAGTYQFAITPLADQNGVATVIITLTDSLGLTASTQFDLTVTATNDAPVLANPISNRIATEGTAYAYTIPSNTFVDVDSGDILTYTATQSNGNALPGWLSFDPSTQTFSGMPTSIDVGSITITITATDGSAESISDTFVLNVNNTNTSPVLDYPIADQTIDEDVVYAFAFAANTFSDADIAFGDTISYTAMLSDGSPLPSWLTFDIANRHFSGTPTNADVGSYIIKVIAEDTLNLTAMDSFYLTVVNVNDAPEISDLVKGASVISMTGLTIDEDTIADAITFSISDIDDTNLTVTLNSSDTTLVPLTNMDYHCTNNSCTMALTPVTNEYGTATITVTVTDPQGVNASNTFNLTVSSINDQPVMTSISGQTINEDAILTGISLTVTDVDESPCSFDIAATSSDMTLIPNDNISYTCSAGTYHFTIAPIADMNGTATIVVMITDSQGLTVSTSFAVSVNAVNDAPVLANPISNQTVIEGTSYAFTMPSNTFVDVDSGDILTYTATQSNGSALPGWLSFDPNAQLLSGLPSNSDVGEITITITATDLSGQSITDTFVLSVNNTNSAPVLDNPIADQTIYEDALCSFSFAADTFSDEDAAFGDTLSYAAMLSDGSPLPSWLTFDIANRHFSGTPTNADVGSYIIKVIAEDTLNLTAMDSFYLTVVNVNDAPEISDLVKGASVISMTGLTIDEDTIADAITFSISDIDDTNLTVTLNSSDTTLVPLTNMDYHCTNNSCTMALTPVTNEYGTATITVTVTDLQGLSDMTSFALTVNSVNDTPVLTGDNTIVLDEDTSSSLNLNATDIETSGCSLNLTYSSSDTSLLPLGNISFTCNDGNYTVEFTPASNQSGNVNLTFTISDPEAASANHVALITVNEINDSPQIGVISDQTMDEGTSIDLRFNITDIEGDVLYVTVTSLDQTLIQDSDILMTNDGNAYTINITPLARQAGITDIRISANDGTDMTVRTFQITVNEKHYMIAGHVSYHTDIAGSNIQGVTMKLTGTYSYNMITDANGYYTFTSVRPGDYTLTASKTDDISLDISDAIKILKAGARKISLNCYEQIAADAYIDGYFGAYDASMVALYVAGLMSCVNDDCQFWQFAADNITSCETWPLIEFESVRHYTNLTGDALNQNFIGIGCGNVAE